MSSNPWRMVAVRLLCAAMLGLLAACGGGGGDGGSGGGTTGGSQDGRVSATLTPAVVAATVVDGTAPGLIYSVRARVTYTGTNPLYVGLASSDGLAQNFGVTIVDGSTLDIVLSIDERRPVGSHRGELQLLVCLDPDCRRPVQGSPIRIPVQLEVLPNVGVAAETVLVRSGRDPAPTLDIPVSVPAAAGELVLSGSFEQPGFSVEWRGNALRVTTGQLPAGTYTQNVLLTSNTDLRYRASAQIVYRVDPPPGGQKPLAFVAGSDSFVSVEQGQVFRQRLQVQRPTWTDSPLSVTLDDRSGRAQLVALGNDAYDLVFDATGAPADTSAPLQVRASAQPWGGEVVLDYRFTVSKAYGISLPGIMLDGSSTAASLTTSGAVVVSSGAPARWTARSLAPWVRLRSSSGTTGVDALTVDVDAATVLAQRGLSEGAIELSIDRPGTLPLTVPLAVNNTVPAVGPTFTDALLPGSGRAYLDGVFDPFNGSRNLQAEGGVLQGTTLLLDPRFIGFLIVMRADLQGLTTGQPLVMRATWPLLTSEVRLPVVDVPRVAEGFATLPRGNWRSAQWSLRQGALYFAADGVVARWSPAGGAWSLQTAAVPGLADVALYGADSLLAAGAQTTWRLDAGTLAVAATGALPSSPFSLGLGLEALPPAATSVLAVAADGAPLAAIRLVPGSGSGIGMLTVGSQFHTVGGSSAHGTDPGSAAYFDDPGSGRPGVGLARSASGEFVVGAYPSGALRVYAASKRFPEFAASIAAGRSVRAVSDDGTRLLLDDGSLVVGGVPVPGRLAALVPAGFEAGGYGLSASGRHAFVYLYRVATEAGAPRARDAALWTVDLGAGTAITADTPVVARQALADAVGCNAALAPGEACTHAAQVAVARGDGSVFVLGPRGVAALPVAPAVTATRAPGPPRVTTGFVPGGKLPAAR